MSDMCDTVTCLTALK